MSFANMFDEADTAKPPGKGGTYFPVGTFIVRIDKFFQHMNQAKIPGVIAECTVLHSTNPELPAGSAVSWMQRAGKKGWEGRVREFVAEVQGVPYAEVLKDVLFTASGPLNPLGGKVCMATGKNDKTLAGTPIVAVQWERLPPADLVAWTAHAKTVGVAAPALD